MREFMLNVGEKIFNVMLVIGLATSVYIGINTIITLGNNKFSYIIGLSQIFGGIVLIVLVSLIVYSLLDIRGLLKKKHETI